MRKIYALSLSLLFALVLFNQITLFSIKSENPLETVVVLRVIDGDTIELTDKRIIRLANINSPEKSSPLSKQSTSFLKQFENNTLKIQVITTDKYGRSVSRLYSDVYLNKLLVERGLASKFLVQEDELSLFSEAESYAISNQKGIWTHSKHYGCFNINVNPEEESVSITNLCGVSLKGFTLKDESRKIYKFDSIVNNSVVLYTKDGQDSMSELFWNSETSIWNNDRDSAYLFDTQNNIAGYYSYGY